MLDFAREIIMAVMATRIRRGAKLHLYLAQWRESRGYSIERFAEQLDVDRTTLWRWETGKRKVKPDVQALIASKLEIEPADLWRLPTARASLDRMVDGQPDEVFAAIADVVRRLTRKAS